MPRIPRRLAFLLVLSLWLPGESSPAAGELPPDPEDWVCAPAKLEMTSKEWCATVRKPRKSAALGVTPALMNDVEGKNAYDAALKNFLVTHQYKEEGLDWYGDLNWRLTGPIVGPLPTGDGTFSGKSYGVHPAVRIYYSPEVIDWLCADRQGEIAPGGMIIKEMRGFGDTAITADANQCMAIQGDHEAQSWAVMVRTSGVTVDGWYWANPSTAMPNPEKPCTDGVAFPKFLDASAITDPGFWNADCPQQEPPLPPSARLDAWFPTGLGSGRWSNVYPWSGFSAYCVNCHASAAGELTYSSLENVLSEGLRYFNYPAMTPATTPLTALRPSLARHDPAMLAESMTETATAAKGPYPSPLAMPLPRFLEFFGNELAPATYADAWTLRMPSETRDHYGAKPGRASDFLTSDQCLGCHDATVSNDSLPNMVFVEEDETEFNLSPYAEWRVSPMGLAGRDPIFFSQLESETLTLPELAACIENTCLHCHGVMGQRQFGADHPGGADAPCKSDIFAVAPPDGVPFGKEPYRRAWLNEWQSDEEHNEYAALSRDGISCTVCHRITAESLDNGESGYTGNFVTADSAEIYGPYADDTIVTKPMEHALGRLPVEGKQVTDSGLCNTCHNILLPVFDNDGKPFQYKGPDGSVLSAKYEQTTGLEWTNSEFSQGATFKSCQDCHMPGRFHEEDALSFKIANIEDSTFAPTTDRLPNAEIELTERDDFTRHALHGLNIFLNQMFQQFPIMLGLRQIDYMNSSTQPALITGAQSMVEMATEQTAGVSITKIDASNDQLEATVLVENKVGHFLPSGVGFRRVFLEFVVHSAEDSEILFASGVTNELGVIVDLSAETCADTTDPDTCKPALGEDFYASKTAYQPHYQKISESGQVQIYQELIKDSAGNLTTSFLRRIDDVKDNRLRARGFDPKVFATNPSPYIQELAELKGEARNDPYYSNPKLTGADEIVFAVPLGGKKPGRVEVTLYSQSIPPFYLQQRFEDAQLAEGSAGNADIRRLFYLTSHLNTQFEQTPGTPGPIADWKLRLAGDCKQADGSACPGGAVAVGAP